MNRTLLTALLALAATLPAAIDPAQAADLTVSDPFARATPTAAVPGVAYLTIHGADTADRLLSVTSPRGAVEMHTMTMQGDIMRMRQVDAIDIPPGATIKLAPGGLHLMVMGLKAPLKQGETVPLTLTFEHAGPRQVEAPVLGLGATAPSPAPHAN